MKKIAQFHIAIILILFFLGLIGKICGIEILKVPILPYLFIGNFIYWILFKRKNKNNLLITKTTRGCENRLYYFSSITNHILSYAIIRGVFKIDINPWLYFITVTIISVIVDIYFHKNKK